MAAPTELELYALGKAEMLALRPDLFANEGDVSDFLLAMATAMAGKNIHYATEKFRATFVDGATGDDLTTLADDHYNIQRSEATKAIGSVAFTRPTGVSGGNIPIGTEIATAVDPSGATIRFLTTSAATFGVADLGPHSATVEAVIAGRGGNVAAGAIVTVISSISFEGGFVCTNAAVTAGGNDAETDEALRDRIRRQQVTFRRATLAALVYGALTIPEVRVASATENTTTGQVIVSISDEDGNSNAQMVNDVIAVLEDYRAAGIGVTVTGGSVLSIDITLTVTLADGAAPFAVLEPFMIAAAEAEISKLKIGETLYDSMVIAAVRNVDPASIRDVDTDLTDGVRIPSANQLIRPGTTTMVEA